MSGGVDSSVCAAMLVEQGFRVFGVTMRVVPDGAGRAPGSGPVADARRVADTLGIPHHVLDCVEVFERTIIADFVAEYLAGRTPNPCARCNPRIKFGLLFDYARERGADLLATGHYVRLVRHGERLALHRAADPAKDQSYYLAGLNQEQLRNAVFPLGGQTKTRTRELARRLRLDAVDRAESQEICFVPCDDYRAFVRERTGPPRPGPILTVGGERVGEHTGLIHYTVGQRKGLGVAAPRPLYVVRLDVERNALIVGYAEDAAARGLTMADVVWGALPPQAAPFDGTVQFRYRQAPVPCSAHPAGDRLEVRFHRAQRPPAPGQWAVLYNGPLVVAGGVIADTEPAAS